MPSNSTFSRAGRSPRSMCVVVIVPLATYCSAWPSTSITPKPVVCRPGSMPRILTLRSCPEIPAHRMEKVRCREAERIDAIEEAVRAGDGHAARTPGGDAAIALERLHHQVAHRAGDACDESQGDRLPRAE